MIVELTCFNWSGPPTAWHPLTAPSHLSIPTYHSTMRDVDRWRQCHRPKNRCSKNKTRKPTVERLRSPHRLKLENDFCWDGQQKLANSKGDLKNSRFVVYAPFQVPEKTPLVAEVEAYGCRNFTRKCSTAAVTMATSNHRSLEEMSQRSGGSSCISCLPFGLLRHHFRKALQFNLTMNISTLIYNQ